MLVLTYSASQAAYPDYEPRFDASAQATTGLQAAPAAFPGLPIRTTLTSVAISVIAILLGRRRKKKKARA